MSRVDLKPRPFRSGTMAQVFVSEDGRPCGDFYLSLPALETFAAAFAKLTGVVPAKVVVAPMLAEEQTSSKPTSTWADRQREKGRELGDDMIAPGQGND